MQQATQVQLSPNGQSSYQPQPIPNLQDKAELPASRENPLQQPEKDKIPRLRAVVKSQAFKNILVDEMDMMLSRAATLIQANWRGHRLRQKLTSQILAAKAIQDTWRRFNTRRLLRSGKAVEKKVSVAEENIPYHPPQQVRFQHSEEARCLPAPPIMMNKETQVPSNDNLAVCAPQLALLQPPGIPQSGVQAPCATGGPSITFLPKQTVSIRLPCPVSLDAECHPCLLTRTIKSARPIHVEGDTMKSKQGTARPNKSGAPGPLPCGRYAQALHRLLQTQTQAHVESEVLKARPQTGQASVMTKTPLQPCLAPTMTMTKTPPQRYLAAAVTKTTLQSCLATVLNKIPTQPCPVPTIMITKTPPQPCLAAPLTKTPAQIQPTASMTNTVPQTRPAAMTSIIKTPPQTCPVPMMAKTLPQMRPAATIPKTPLQTCPVVMMAKSPSQTLPGSSTTKTPHQTRLGAMISKTPIQLRSVATILRTLRLPPPAAGNLKVSPPAVVAAGISNTLSHTYLNRPKAKAVVTARRTAGMVKVLSHSHSNEEKVKYCPPPHLKTGTSKAPARPFSEAEKIKTSQKQVKIATVSNTNVAEDGSKVLSQARPKRDAMKTQSQVCVPIEMSVVLPTQMATCSTTPSPPGHLLPELTAVLPQANLGMYQSKHPAQAHPPAKLTKALALAHLGTCQIKAQSQTLLPGFKASTQPCQHANSFDTLSQAKPENPTQTPIHSYAWGKAPQGPHQGSSKTQSMLVPLLASAGHPICNVEFRGDSRASQAQLSTVSPAVPCQEEMVASQLASLCALATVLSSQEDLCSLLQKALSQGEVRATLNQALSKEVLGTTMTKALPQGMLGTVLVKVLSWGKLGATLSHTLSQGELQAELTKVMQGKLESIRSQALTEEEQAGLSQALSQGELGAVLSQSLSQVALKTGLVLPKATSKTLESGMMVTPAPVEVDYKGRLSAAWGDPASSVAAHMPQSLSHGMVPSTVTSGLAKLACGSSVASSFTRVCIWDWDPDPKHFLEARDHQLSGNLAQSSHDALFSSRKSYTSMHGSFVSEMLDCSEPSQQVEEHASRTAQGPVDAGVAGGQAWNSVIPSVAVRPMKSAEVPCGAWEQARCTVPWNVMGSEAAVDPRQLGELVASVQAVEKITAQAAVTIQACARGYLVRRTIKVWHQWAIIIQAAWRGFCVRRNLAKLCGAATIIQATWRGYYFRRNQAQKMLLPGTLGEVGGRTRPTSNHRCFQSCPPHVCAICQSLSPRLGNLPSAVMLMGSSPRTCHMCGHTLPTRVVQGMGQGTMGHAGMPRGYDTQMTPQNSQHIHCQNKAATVIQSAWKGFGVRRWLRQQKTAAKMLQATWRGHYTRASLTTDALLGPAAWDNPRNTQWPGV
ncbi:LOW QUALITY PROTEIN: IQ domain-containing protein N [Rhynchonycteris naso]